mmetsp:Transcript_13987/g.16909  ORF Transcript_13987/g.16909 Transcript_13987/m.16909 type:complete len:461 (-) Transcript_13987:1359-2741(-)
MPLGLSCDPLLIKSIVLVDKRLLLCLRSRVVKSRLEGGVGPSAHGTDKVGRGILSAAEGARGIPPLNGLELESEFLTLEWRDHLLLVTVVVAEVDCGILLSGNVTVVPQFSPAAVQLLVHACRPLLSAPPQAVPSRGHSEVQHNHLTSGLELRSAVAEDEFPVLCGLLCVLVEGGGVAGGGVMDGVGHSDGREFGEPVHGSERGAQIDGLVREALLEEGATDPSEVDPRHGGERGAVDGKGLDSIGEVEERLEVVVGLIFEANFEVAVCWKHVFDLVDERHLGPGIRATEVGHFDGLAAFLNVQVLNGLGDEIKRVHDDIEASEGQLGVQSLTVITIGHMGATKGVLAFLFLFRSGHLDNAGMLSNNLVTGVVHAAAGHYLIPVHGLEDINHLSVVLLEPLRGGDLHSLEPLEHLQSIRLQVVEVHHIVVLEVCLLPLLKASASHDTVERLGNITGELIP